MNRYFKRSEFACSCGCNFSTVDVELLEVLTDLRKYFGRPITINSACRCESHNKAVGGAEGSKHRLGIAADVVVKGIHPNDVFDHLADKYPDKYGLGCYTTFTHVDVRSNEARW